MKKIHNRSFDLLSNFDWCLLDGKGTIKFLLFFLLGVILGNIVAAAYMIFAPSANATFYAQLIAYPCMFIPAMIWSSAKSREARIFTERQEAELPIDKAFFGSLGWGWMIPLVMVMTISGSILCDNFSIWMPKMPQWLEEMLGGMTNGDSFWLNFLMVSIFAPFFEEWLCRGMICRGLSRTKLGAVGAILVSALIFALIHGNPWQALPAFVLGTIFGYVYMKTGSLKLTMLMHFTNNSVALLTARNEALSEVDSLIEVLGSAQYISLVGAAALLLIGGIWIISSHISGTIVKE